MTSIPHLPRDPLITAKYTAGKSVFIRPALRRQVVIALEIECKRLQRVANNSKTEGTKLRIQAKANGLKALIKEIK